MNKFPIIAGIITIIIIIAGVFIFSGNKTVDTTVTLPTNLEYFWLEGCPHCKIVQDFIDTWAKKDQIKIDKLEVKTNRENASKLLNVGKYCKIDSQSLGAVPLLFTPQGKCFLGDQPIIDYLKTL